MDIDVLTDEQWVRVAPLLPGQVGTVGVSAKDNRLFLEAVLWIARTDGQWRDLPERFGKWNSVFVRYNRWSKTNVWQRLFDALRNNPDFEYAMIDSTIIRAHQHAAGAKGGQENQALESSRGGFSTRVHAVVDALGNPLRFRLTAGQSNDFPEAVPLLSQLSFELVMILMRLCLLFSNSKALPLFLPSPTGKYRVIMTNTSTKNVI